MPDYDAFGREIADDQPAAQPAEPDTPPPAPPRRRRSGGGPNVAVVVAVVLVVVAAAVGTLAFSGGSSSGVSNLVDATTSDLERSADEFEKAIERSEADPDAPSALTAEGARAAIATLRKEADDPRGVAFEATRTIAILPPERDNGTPAVFTWVVNKGSDSPNGFRSEKRAYVRLKPFAWDDVDPAVLERVVEQVGGAEAVDQVAYQLERGEPRWTAYLRDESERDFDAAGAPVS